VWLEKAAQADEPDAQVSLAEYLLREHATSESTAGALTWLERASKQGNSTGKFILASVLAAAPVDHDRDPTRALALTDGIEHEFKHDPSFWEIRAAAKASQGKFADALKDQEKAISEA